MILQIMRSEDPGDPRVPGSLEGVVPKGNQVWRGQMEPQEDKLTPERLINFNL